MLRVAHDVALIAQDRAKSVTVFGISRVVEETLERLVRDPQLELVLVGVAGADVFIGGSGAALYADDRWPDIPADRGFGGRRIGPQTYDRLHRPLIFGEGSRTRRLAARAVLKTLKRLDATPGFVTGPFDVYHSTFLPLPPVDVTGQAARVISVYDLIPHTHPETATAGQRHLLDRTIASIDPRRDHVIVNSVFVADEVMRTTGQLTSRLHVVPLAASAAFHGVERRPLASEFRDAHGIPDRPYVLSVASTQPRKNLPLLIEAFERAVSDGRTDASLVLVGGSAWSNEAAERAIGERPHLAERLVQTGYVSDADLLTLYAGASLFVFPSRAEGFGLPVLEAMAAGIPVITTTASAMPEVAGDAAVLVGPDDARELARQIRALLGDPSEAAQRSTLGRQRAQEFSWERTAAATADVYRAAAGAGSATSP